MSSLVIAKCLLVLFVVFGIAFPMAAALPAAGLEVRDVYVPRVTYPHAGVEWIRGQKHNVTWDVTNPPTNITNRYGKVILRKGDLATPLILAKDFDILLGRVEVTIPWVMEDKDYSIVLFGDSGNWSGEFTIKEN